MSRRLNAEKHYKNALKSQALNEVLNEIENALEFEEQEGRIEGSFLIVGEESDIASALSREGMYGGVTPQDIDTAKDTYYHFWIENKKANGIKVCYRIMRGPGSK